MKKVTERFIYYLFRNLITIGLRVYYKEVTVSGLEKFPVNNPVMTVSNHPTGLMDVFLVLYHIKKQIKFTAAGSLFKDKLQATFLTSAGAIPLYRQKDTPDEMDKNVDSFENCFQELETGGAIGFYPEGTSHPEPWVNPIKTGAARIALQQFSQTRCFPGLSFR
jgi:1-acyl-sn-glycerol-3-phosphate acyltransferase